MHYNIARFNQHDVSPMCPLCQAASEDRLHFLLECFRLQSVRLTYLLTIEQMLNETDTIKTGIVMSSRSLLIQLIMDSTKLKDLIDLNLSEEAYIRLESISRDMCFALHLQRSHYLGLN